MRGSVHKHQRWMLADRVPYAASSALKTPSPQPSPGRRGSIVALLVLLCAVPAFACRPEVRAEVPLRVVDGFPLVTAEIAGRAVTLLLDTAAHQVLLLPDAAARLGMPPDLTRATRLLGTGGVRDVPNVRLDSLRVGGIPVPAGSVPVADLPGVPTTEPPLAGLLGGPLLAATDVMLDVAAGRMTLLAPTGCAPLGGTPVPLAPLAGGDYAFTLLVNGSPVLAIPDTGARLTLLSSQAARRLGLNGPVAASTARGVDGQRVPMRALTLRTLQVGSDVARNMPISATDLQIAPAEMLLGLDWFRRRRVWLSYATGRMAVWPPTPSP